MAIARTVDPAAVARNFADEISSIPEVKRVWYWSKLGHIEPSLLSLDFYVLLDPSTESADTAVATALVRLQERYLDEAALGLQSFIPWHLETYGIEEMVHEGSIELALRGD